MKIIILRLRTARNIFNALPEDWKNIISPCTKYTFNSENVTATVDKIFLLSEYEIFGKNSYANSSTAIQKFFIQVKKRRIEHLQRKIFSRRRACFYDLR